MRIRALSGQKGIYQGFYLTLMVYFVFPIFGGWFHHEILGDFLDKLRKFLKTPF